jgi:DNA-binding response OmpR family regulator
MSAVVALGNYGQPVILMVEDEVRIRRESAEVLRAANFAVDEATNADEALQILRSGAAVDVVVSDVRMPGSIDGLALARVIKAEFPSAKVVLTSGYELKGPAEGVDDFLLKPVHPAELVRRVSALINRTSGKQLA